MEVESVLVTGANRGIGLEFVKQLLQLPKPPHYVFATYRNDKTTQALEEVKEAHKQTHVVLIKMDIEKTNEIENAKKIVEGIVGDKGLNLLINNAGILKIQVFREITEENLLRHFSTNTIGPVMVLKEMLPLLQKSAARKTSGMNISRAAVLNLSATLGSISLRSDLIQAKWLETIGYRTSKAALNMAMQVIARTVKDQGILVVNICPGWVKTDMGTSQAMLEVTESISAIIETLKRLNETHHGSFLDRNGNVIPF
ncbi:uncharacterized protein CEXT_500491 [Caerostris extrusa]|uniref:C-factor n=1 Tax=Caerostris extrusa TaxID=172846 RepID=A0AAV4N222_CAEEX|nr:uncharacterized protein CEXT_500491 [Caerostris extrusa]